MAITVKPLTRTVGAEIGGIDISKPFSDSDYKAIRQAWLDYGVIVFRGQSLDDSRQVAFAERFGELQKVRTRPGTSDHPAIMYIGNRVVNGMMGNLPTGEMQFHSDQCYYENPACGSMLFAIEIPSVGGNTLFTDCRAAYDDLPAVIRARVDGLKALNIYDYAANPTEKAKQSAEDAPKFVHPVIRTHPETGRKGIYVNRLMTDHIVGMDDDEGAALLETLYAKIEERRYIYEHVWQPGDLLMWDNRRVAHARSDFDPNELRWMRRITVAGDRPY